MSVETRLEDIKDARKELSKLVGQLYIYSAKRRVYLTKEDREQLGKIANSIRFDLRQLNELEEGTE